MLGVFHQKSLYIKEGFLDFYRLHLDFSIYAGWEGEILKALNRLWSSVADVDEALVNFHLESFTTGLIDMWGLYYSESAALSW